MCENGVNPNGIIRLMKEIKREKTADVNNFNLDF